MVDADSERKYFPKYKDTMAEELEEINGNSGVDVDPNYINYYEKFHEGRNQYNLANNIPPDVPLHKTVEL